MVLSENLKTNSVDTPPSPLTPVCSPPPPLTITSVATPPTPPTSSKHSLRRSKDEEMDSNSRGKPRKGFWHGFKIKKHFKNAKLYLPSWKRKVEIDPGVLQSLVEDRKPLSTPIREAQRLQERLGEAAMGKTFLLQAGDDGYDESFEATFRVILQMSAVLMFGGQKPVIKVGNQFAKRRSDASKEKDGMKSDNLNVDALDLKSSTLHPRELIKAYHPRTGGYAAIQRVSQWNLDFMENNEHGDRYRALASQVDEAIGYMSAASLAVDHPTTTTTDFWTSREGLPYEHSLTYKDSTSGLSYDCSAHLLWVGARTSQLDGAHVKFLKRIANPLGIKVSDKMDPDTLVKLVDILNPDNKPGRITIITRMGAENIRMKLPNIVRKVQRVGQIVTWVTDPDPMPYNTIKAPSSLKTHPFNAIQAEVRAFFDVHEQEGSYPGGIHLEMTGQKEIKCNSGSRTPAFGHTNCDPRLDASESLELAFIIAERLRKQRMAARSTN